MTESMQMFAANVERILREGVQTEGEFINLAIAGEHLRRGLLHEGDDADEAGVLASYDRFLRDGVSWSIDHAARQASVVEALREYASEPIAGREQEYGRELLLDLDSVLAVAGASTRAGLFENESLEGLANGARASLEELSASMIELASFARRRGLRFGRDPEFPTLYAFYDELSQYAPESVSVEAALTRAARYSKLVERAADKFQSVSLVEWIRQGLRKVVGTLSIELEPAMVGALSDGDEGEPVKIATIGGLEILRDRVRLHVVLPEVQTASGESLETELYPPRDGASVRLPVEDDELVSWVTIAGDRIELPRLQLRREAT
jgi:hypothetical protein